MTDSLEEERITDEISDAQALEVVKREAEKIDEALREDEQEPSTD